MRQLRELARSRQTTVRVHPDLPEVEVNAAAVELCLMNYLSNALKYADSGAGERWVEISGRIQPASSDAPACAVIEVTDNGLGVPAQHRDKLFQRFFRAGVDSTSKERGSA